LLETNITNKVIPSSIDPSLNRFKFGFFADDFSTDVYSDTNNPQYAASIEAEGDFGFGFIGNPLEDSDSAKAKSDPLSKSITQPSKLVLKQTNRLTPPKQIWSLRHFTDNPYFIDDLVIEQNNATESENPCVLGVEFPDNTFDNGYFTAVNELISTVYVDDVPGVTTLYFYIYSNIIGTRCNLNYRVANKNIRSIVRREIHRLYKTRRYFA